MAELNDHASREHAQLSASSAYRWLNCPPSAKIADTYPRKDTAFTREGTLAHEVAEYCGHAILGGGIVDPEHFGDTEGVDAEMIDHGTAYGEYLAGLITSDTDFSALEVRVDYSTWVPDGFGTADAIILHADGLMDVVDYKYGKGVQVSAEDNPQMKLYALGALAEYVFAYPIERIRMHIFQPRIGNISVSELMVEDLMEWGESIAPIAETASEGKGKMRGGDWCRFCPHAGQCAEMATEIRELIAPYQFKTTLTSEEVADVLAMEPMVTLWLKRVREQALASMLEGKTIPDFKVVAGRGSREWVDEGRVVDELRANGYTADDFTKTELLSPNEMEKYFGKKRVGELLGGLIAAKQGSPTIAPASDKRPEYSTEETLVKDFE